MLISPVANRRRHGFTIVELLIVIVVIAILAAITVVAYNGIQQRATNAAITAAASQSIKAIQAYIAANDAYPGTSSSCLTPTSGCVYGGTTTAANTYSWVDDHALAGRNFYRIRCQGLDGSSRLSQVLGVKFGQTDAGISLYPNPVTNGVFTIQYSGMEKGTYQLRLLNNGGQLIFNKAFEHSGSNASQTVSLPMPIVAANYYMEITGPGGYRHIEKVRIQNH